jgi:hypothetical protein
MSSSVENEFPAGGSRAREACARDARDAACQPFRSGQVFWAPACRTPEPGPNRPRPACRAHGPAARRHRRTASVTLLVRRLAVGNQPRVDHRPVQNQLRRRPTHRRVLRWRCCLIAFAVAITENTVEAFISAGGGAWTVLRFVALNIRSGAGLLALCRGRVSTWRWPPRP